MSLIIRPACKEDASSAAFLLAETTGEFGVEVVGLGSEDLQIRALEEWFQDEKNRFSYQHTLIGDKYGVAAGLLLAFPGSMLNRLVLGCGRRIFHIYGFFRAIRMAWLNRTLADNKEAERDEYLIAHLAVDAHFRRQGIAQALLAKAAEDSLALGIQKLVLEVEIDNHSAFALYRKAGFETVNTIYFNDKAEKLKCPGFYKMLKNL
jgi:ribosomal protein S18 acetylase RimI-like enzyme